MSRIPRWLLISLLAVTAPVALVGTAHAVDRGIHAGKVLRNVQVGAAELSGLGVEDARRRLDELEDRLLDSPRTFLVVERSFSLDPQTVAYRIDREQAVRDALRAGREGSFLRQLLWWLGSFREPEIIPVPGMVDGEALDAILDDWEGEAIEDPPYPGGVAIEDARPVPDYPRAGRAIDRRPAHGVVREALSGASLEPVEIPVVVAEPILDPSDVDRAVLEAVRLLAGPVTLRRDDPEVEVTFSAEELASALRSEVVVGSDPRIDLRFDPERIEELLRPLKDQLEMPPRDAGFAIHDDETVTVIPGRPGTLIHPEETAAALRIAAESSDRTGQFPFQAGAQPEFTTEEAEALGIERKVSEFTTNHNCCEPRVDNIHLMADIVDGAIVRPGETFSLNDHVGKRTAERGFVSAPVIYAGEFTEDVGGGVSQFATTFYNAVFFGGYQDVEHQPHSFYISRYPEGREATISWPRPDLVFRNDSEAGILIKTSYTETSITVTFYGDNGGRRVEAGLSGRFNFTDPPVEYVGDPSLDPDQERVLQRGFQGWTVVVYRTITYPDDRVVEEEWPVRYRPSPRILAVHPCNIPEGEEGYTGEECPEPEPEEEEGESDQGA